MGEAAKEWEPKVPDYASQKKVDVDKVSEEYRKKLLEGSEEYQVGKEAKEYLDGIAKASAEEKMALKKSMEDMLGGFKINNVAVNEAYKNLMREIESNELNRDLIDKFANEAIDAGEKLLSSIDEYLSKMPEIKDPELLAVRKEISNLYLDTGNIIEECRRNSFPILGKKKTAAA